MNWLPAALQILLVVTPICFGLRTNTKDVRAFCLLYPDGQQFQMLFKIMLDQTHPVGQLYPIVAGGETVVNDGCDFSVEGQEYTVMYDVDVNVGATTDDQNKCGLVRTRNTVQGYWIYTWRIAFIENKAVTDTIMWDDLDKIYTFSCREDQLTNRVLETAVQVSAPNLNQGIDFTAVNVILRVLKQVTPTVASGGDYEVATTAVPAGYWIALEMVLSLPADFNGAIDPYGVYGTNAVMSGTDDFATIYNIFGSDGCPSSGANTMPYVPAVGFEYLVSATSVVANGAWVIRTGPFYALKIEGSNTMNFRVTFGLCFGTPDTNGICAQSCQTARRRKRDSPEHREVVTSIVVEDGDERFHIGRADKKTAEGSSKVTGTMLIAIIVSSVVGILLIICLIVMIVACRSRRRRGENVQRNYDNFSNPPSVIIPTKKI